MPGLDPGIHAVTFRQVDVPVEWIAGIIMFRYYISWQWQLIWFCGLSLASVLCLLYTSPSPRD